MTKCNTFLTCCLMFSSVTFVSSGIGLIAVGAMAAVFTETYKTFFGAKYRIGPIVTVTLGLFVLISSCNAFYGAVTKKAYLLLIFVLLFTVLFCVEIIAAVFAYAYRKDIMDTLEVTMKESLRNYNNNYRVKEFWDYIQLQLKCCGVRNSADYKKHSLQVPKSCCNEEKTCADASQKRGCLTTLYEIALSHIVLVSGVSLATAINQILSVVLAIVLANSILAREEYSQEVEEQPENTNQAENEIVFDVDYEDTAERDEDIKRNEVEGISNYVENEGEFAEAESAPEFYIVEKDVSE